jgi:hypothetical protein
MTYDSQDCFGVPKSAFSAAQASHESAYTVRTGMYPDFHKVASMAPETLRPILIDWLHESPSELISTSAQINQVKAILEARPDATALAELGDLIERASDTEVEV